MARTRGPITTGARGGYDKNRHWWSEPDLIPDEDREFPQTVPHEVLATHPMKCRCLPCAEHPNRGQLRRLKLRASGLPRESGRPRARRPRGA